MRITFCGAARTVTGSCYLVECADTRFLVDCGMFQGSDENLFERDSFPFNPSDISFVLLTHAHIDHSGRLPLLLKCGFSGKIYCTSATRKLSDIMLLDSAHIQEMEAEWGYKKAKRGSGKAYKPLYDTIDAAKCSKRFVSIPYDKVKKLAPSVSVRFRDAGHLLGSAHIEVWLKEGGVEKKIVFSGDIGNKNQPIIKNPTIIEEADYVLCESTYGDKFHSEDSSRFSSLDRAKKLAEIIDRTFSRGGNLVIPAFAVGRTQEILYLLYMIHKKKLLPYKVPTFIDSPLGIKATDIFSASSVECYDSESSRLVANGENILHFPTLLIAETQEESQKINGFPDPCVIISSSGMCNAGRIKHHLKYNLWRSES
ncbi:MAG TPA: MBL fold hydrolase, partial [Spirochaetaceae bacterium]|nr:MBL fold hydrolase [Spirochaetaceae bacterium]